MASASNTSKPPTAGLVVPKLEPGPSAVPNLAEAHVNTESSEVWSSEMQYVASLTKLQKMEAMIHQLRTLLPERLLEPVVPIVNPRAASRRPPPKSPRVLYEQLAQTARAGVAEVREFQEMWQSAEMKEIWGYVDGRIRANAGQLLQPTGMWERDYDVLLAEMEREERGRKEQEERVEEEAEQAKIQAMEGGWRAIVEAFVRRNVPGVRVLPSKDQPVLTVVLVKAGITVHVQELDGEGHGVSDWRVMDKAVPGKPKTKLELGIMACLNARPRQWDLAHLLDMISAYSAVKQTPCAKCGKMTNSAAQLPTIRQPKPTSDGQESSLQWDAYHTDCI
ncbi:RNA polymerase II mediator complex subunit MED27 domain-containing protein [Aspergillus clavatus NRRL 1]|uniref:Mediator complex subunit 27-domain-containing protein n=1 Tax=Aspergillus clavatus (strain ATCC 1007 / CBS 513.65 / DSM 816 / NCTC 3887 / NRRL 1 / QM 1276 / 107) TaxID=344612 RepID=A1C992_ASPCL|nr:uncharacterized protein ACLA_054630 [Aspergillus clavatus NRRL 1]EAW13416.1 conserved hypothetical protein [Aspergillus clavatus NRRL 1]